MEFNPSRGAEMRKTRPAVIVNMPTAGKLPLRVIVPLTEWHPAFERSLWHVRIEADATNGLSKVSAADTFQVRSCALERCIRRLGALTLEQMEAIVEAMARVTGYTAPA